MTKPMTKSKIVVTRSKKLDHSKKEMGEILREGSQFTPLLISKTYYSWKWEKYLRERFSMVILKFILCFVPGLERYGFSGRPFIPFAFGSYTKTKVHSQEAGSIL